MSFSSSVSPEWSLFRLAPLTIRLPNVQVVENPASTDSVNPTTDITSGDVSMNTYLASSVSSSNSVANTTTRRPTSTTSHAKESIAWRFFTKRGWDNDNGTPKASCELCSAVGKQTILNCSGKSTKLLLKHVSTEHPKAVLDTQRDGNETMPQYIRITPAFDNNIFRETVTMDN
ncbi:unnamed protein product [Absidia cylindrospora]